MRRLALSACVIAACASPLEVEHDELAQARDRWEQSGPSSYRFTLERYCFCGPRPLQPMIVTVANDTFVSLTDTSGAPLDTLSIGSFLTIDRIFAFLEETIARPPEDFAADYDRQLGYPRNVVIDRALMPVDGGLRLLVSDLHPLLARASPR